MYHSDEELNADDGGFKILSEAAVVSQPGEAAFDDPTSRQQGEAGRSIGPFDDLRPSLSDLAQRAVEFLPGIGAVDEDMAQTRKRRAERSQSLAEKNCVLSCGCESSAEELDGSDEEPGFGAGDGGFEVLGEVAVASQTGETAFDDPTSEQ